MIPLPLALWAGYNLINCIIAASGEKIYDRRIGFSFSLGVSALSCGLLVAGLTGTFLIMELCLWLFQMLVVVIAVGVKPPGTPSENEGQLALSATFRFGGAIVAWLCM
jgi:hypothetical protein